VILGKTAELFAAASRIGAVVAEQSEGEMALASVWPRSRHRLPACLLHARFFGVGRLKLGKSIGDDFPHGKVTLPILLAFARRRRARADLLARHA